LVSWITRAFGAGEKKSWEKADNHIAVMSLTGAALVLKWKKGRLCLYGRPEIIEQKECILRRHV
jgi:hypothetical protein